MRRALYNVYTFTFFLLSLTVFASPAMADMQRCDLSADPSIVYIGDSTLVSWHVSGYANPTLNGVPVPLGDQSQSFIINVPQTFTLQASQGPNSCSNSVNVIPIPRPDDDPGDPGDDPGDPPPDPDPDPDPNPDPDPTPAAEAYLEVYTDGFATPITSGTRTIDATAQVSKIVWWQQNAVRCESRGFSTGGDLSGTITGGADLVLAKGQTKEYEIRCANSVNEWSNWRSVEIIKDDDTSNPPGGDTAPDAPIIRGADINTSAPLSVTKDTLTAFTFRATDSDGDSIRYQIDWNNDGTTDMTLPAPGYVPSGTALSSYYTWAAPARYTIKARTQDDTGRLSGWTSHELDVTEIVLPPPPPKITLQVDKNVVRVGGDTQAVVNVRAGYPVSCQIFGVKNSPEDITYNGSGANERFSFPTNSLFATQVIKVVCTPEAPGFALPEEVREARVTIVPEIEEV